MHNKHKKVKKEVVQEVVQVVSNQEPFLKCKYKPNDTKAKSKFSQSKFSKINLSKSEFSKSKLSESIFSKQQKKWT